MKRVAGVRAALESGYRRIAPCEHIHNLTFALVAPLKPEDYIDFRTHCFLYALLLLIFQNMSDDRETFSGKCLERKVIAWFVGRLL